MYKQNLAWSAHRNSSVKPRPQDQQQQLSQNNNTGSQTQIKVYGFEPKRAIKHNDQGHVRPGTAPKQALVNNLAGQIQNRPMSPYSKNFNNGNQAVTNMNTRKRSSSRRGPAAHPQNQFQLNSSNIQQSMYGKQISSQNQRRSQSPAANAHRGTAVSGSH